MRGWGFGGGDCFVDWRTESAGFEGGSEVIQERGYDLCFFCDRSSAQRRAEYFQMAAEYGGQIDLSMRSLHQADQDEVLVGHRSTVHRVDDSALDDPARWAMTWRAYRRKFGAPA